MAQIRNEAEVARLAADFRVRCGWRVFTPTLYQNGTVASTPVANACAFYTDDGKMTIMATLTSTAIGTIANPIRIFVPLPASLAPITGGTPNVILGGFQVVRAGLAHYVGMGVYDGIIVAGSLSFSGIVDASANYIGASPSFALAVNDIASVNVTYRL